MTVVGTPPAPATPTAPSLPTAGKADAFERALGNARQATSRKAMAAGVVVAGKPASARPQARDAMLWERGDDETRDGTARSYAPPPMPLMAEFAARMAAKSGPLQGSAAHGTLPTPAALGEPVPVATSITRPDIRLTIADPGSLLRSITVQTTAGGGLAIVVQASSSGALRTLRTASAQLARRLGPETEITIVGADERREGQGDRESA